MKNTKPRSDICTSGWISLFPKKYRPYAVLARLDRPIGIWLLFLPALWSITLASVYTESLSVRTLWLCFLFGIGAFVMRSAGCVVNDLWDRNIDAQVERTKNRPLASGELTPYQAVWFLGLLLITGCFILLSMNDMTVFLGFLSIPFIITYPFMKRVTFWPQAFLGLTFNFGALMGWSAVTDGIGLPALFLYCAGIAWTLGYDTIYAHQDKDDDALLGLKSTALKFGKDSKWWLSCFYIALWLFIALAIFSHPSNNALCYVGLLAVATHLAWQIMAWKIDDPTSALKIFKSNRDLGFLILFTFVLCAL